MGRSGSGGFHLRPNLDSKSEGVLQFFEKLARRARDVDPARDAAFSIFHTLHDACRLAAFRTVRTLGRVHHLLAVSRLCDLYCHSVLSPDLLMSAQRAPRKADRGGMWMGSCRIWGSTQEDSESCVADLFRRFDFTV
jgi:hypothetical protein